jgi:acid phosphatase (class A)
MRRIRTSSAVILVTILAALACGASKPKFLQPQDVDWASILPGPPDDNSAQHQDEIATVFHWQNKRTAEDVQRCKKEVSADGFIFAQVLGDWFNPRALPITADLLNQAWMDGKVITNAAKKKWDRPRPYEVDKRIRPCVEEEATPSYPSGHAVRGIIWATILAEMFPDHHDQLMALGRQFGDDRVIAGVHWPSDVEAGQKLGAEIAARLLDNMDFKTELQRAKEECMAVAAH